MLPVKLSIDEATHIVHTLDISNMGAQIGGLRTQLQPGTIVSLKRGPQKAKFRIAWIRQLTPHELRAGIECLEPQKDFWGVDLSDPQTAQNNVEALMTLLSGSSKR